MSPFTRREFVRDAALVGAGVTTCTLAEASAFAADARKQGANAAQATALSALPLSWVGEASSPVPTGVSWGVPWPQGTIRRDAVFSLSMQGANLPLQTWPLAYWPDGSLKWSGFAAVLPAGASGQVTLTMGSASSGGTVKVTQDSKAVLVDTGALRCSIPRTGPDFLSFLSLGGKQVGGAGQLICILQTDPETDPEDSPQRERYISEVKQVTVEQSGPVRAVVKIEGMHRGSISKREWLPFTLRLYFYTGQTAVRVVHTIIFDGDQEKDFVRGMGLQIDVPLRDEPRNRTVRFSGADGGVWSEPLQPGGGSVAQESGQEFTGSPVFGKNAVWDHFKLVQPNPDGFTVVKRTNPKSTWIFSAAGSA